MFDFNFNQTKHQIKINIIWKITSSSYLKQLMIFFFVISFNFLRFSKIEEEKESFDEINKLFFFSFNQILISFLRML